jgi:phosphatidylethanolamine/phosphatidyl-N-methylethanolamine N-methyltransferase
MKLGTDIDDAARFLLAWIEKPLAIGSVTPSSPALARMVAEQVDMNILGPIIELGPGTGPVTEALVARGIPPERLVLIEFNPNFCVLLRARYPKATVIEGNAYDIEEQLSGMAVAPASAVISGLPLFTKPVSERVSLLRTALARAQPGAPFIQFTYAVTSPVPRDTPGILSHRSTPIWLNFPPARVWTYRDISRMT